ncbi:MAG: glycosyltransferase family 25 protein [Kiritimatiellia bacterium]|jgi:GR25 family glycosyltransferase involved in LPS biosynthesis|nr:glycosyltransferase family 25 protein [Kiritimatiellia bacterium]
MTQTFDRKGDHTVAKRDGRDGEAMVEKATHETGAGNRLWQGISQKTEKPLASWHQCFSTMFYINLDSSRERRQHAESEFSRIGIVVERFSAIRPDSKGGHRNTGVLGCKLSHLAVLRCARENKLKNIVIFEDDVLFSAEFEQRVDMVIRDLLEHKWDLFYFYTKHSRVISKTESGLCKITSCGRTHALAINESAYDRMIELILTGPNKPVDKLYRRHLHKQLDVYGVEPDLAIQNRKLFASDIDPPRTSVNRPAPGSPLNNRK